MARAGHGAGAGHAAGVARGTRVGAAGDGRRRAAAPRPPGVGGAVAARPRPRGRRDRGTVRQRRVLLRGAAGRGPRALPPTSDEDDRVCGCVEPEPEVDSPAGTLSLAAPTGPVRAARVVQVLRDVYERDACALLVTTARGTYAVPGFAACGASAVAARRLREARLPGDPPRAVGGAVVLKNTSGSANVSVTRVASCGSASRGVHDGMACSSNSRGWTDRPDCGLFSAIARRSARRDGPLDYLSADARPATNRSRAARRAPRVTSLRRDREALDSRGSPTPRVADAPSAPLVVDQPLGQHEATRVRRELDLADGRGHELDPVTAPRRRQRSRSIALRSRSMRPSHRGPDSAQRRHSSSESSHAFARSRTARIRGTSHTAPATIRSPIIEGFATPHAATRPAKTQRRSSASRAVVAGRSRHAKASRA